MRKYIFFCKGEEIWRRNRREISWRRKTSGHCNALDQMKNGKEGGKYFLRRRKPEKEKGEYLKNEKVFFGGEEKR